MAINIQAEYNLLNECKYIKNKDRCVHDTNHGFEALFGKGNCGFTNNTNMDWLCPSGLFLWGIASAESCYISLADPLSATFEADYFGDFEIDMLVRYDEDSIILASETLVGRLEWQTEVDSSWEDAAYVELEITPDGNWHRYTKVMFENPYWVGNITNLRFYPFTNGVASVEFMIKRLAFRSDTHYKCKYPPCAFNDSYSHPCSAIGKAARAYSITRVNQATVDVDNFRIGVSLDDYSIQYIDLDLNHCTDNYAIAQELTIKMNTLSFGGYKFAECYYDDVAENFSIYTGTKGKNGSVNIYHGGDKDVSVSLGFFSDTDTPTWRSESGIDPVDGFISAYQKIPATVLYRLPNSESPLITFDPAEPMVYAGRANLQSLPMETTIEEGNVPGSLFLDIFGRANYEGYINHVQFKGNIISGQSRIFLLRPIATLTFSIMYISDLLTSSDLVSGQDSLHQIDINWYLRPGDIFGLYMCLPALDIDDNSKVRPDMQYKYSWIDLRDTSLAVGDSLTYTTENIKFYGFQGLPVYGYSDTLIPGYGIEAELRYEYGVSHVAMVGTESNCKVDMDLMTLDITKVRVSSNVTTGDLQDAPSADLLTVFSEEDDPDNWWIEFWFPTYVKSVYKIVTTFEDSENIRGFDWEYYLNENDRGTLSWTEEFKYPTEAVGVGSAVGWLRLGLPLYVYLDGSTDMTQHPYIGQNYVTDDPYDYYPGVTDQQRITRFTKAYGVRWNKLEQIFYPVDTHGLRLYVWRWASARITSVQIWAQLTSTETILHAIEGWGASGPLVFDTERYNVVDRTGELWQSSRISRAKTSDYTYGLDFDFQDNDDMTTVVAEVGTTMSHLEIDLVSLPVQIQQIKLIPQHIAVQLREADSKEPITEISNLSWGSPSDGSDYTYGPAQPYTVYNDTGFRAALILNIADPLAVDQSCVFYSTLASSGSLSDPARGTYADIIRSPDTYITNDKGINYHARVYTPIEVTPTAWHSSTNSGITWQTLTSGNPFTETVMWNEPINPYNTDWKVYNWAKSDSVTISGGLLSITTIPRYYTVESGAWLAPTYFQDVARSDTFLLETQILGGMTQQPGTDVSAGIVIFDKEDNTKSFRIERYTGNNLSTVSGGFNEDNAHLNYAFGDYVRWGPQVNFAGVSGCSPDCLTTSRYEYSLLLKLIQNGNAVDVFYRLPYEGWTTVSSYSIVDWSKNIRIGVYGNTQAVSKVINNIKVPATFDYLSYKDSTPRRVEDFNQDCNFSELTTTWSGWTAYNTEHTSLFCTSADAEGSLKIRKWVNDSDFKYFDHYLQSPALLTTWGSITDYDDVLFRLTGYDDRLMVSGSYSAGLLLRDSSDYNNSIKYAYCGANRLEIRENGGNKNYLTIDPVTSTSGLWLKLDKACGVVVLGYSYDGSNFEVASGISLWDWSEEAEVELAVATDVGDITFDYFQFGRSRLDATNMAASFNPKLPLLNIYGTGFDWGTLYYSTASGLENFTTTKPPAVSHVMFLKDQENDVDFDAVKFIPDVRAAKSEHFSLNMFEIPQANQQLFDYTGSLMLVDPVLTESGSGWSENLSYKGIPLYDSPVLLLDLREVYNLGRCPLATNLATGRFSATDTNYPIDATWGDQSYEQVGFGVQCKYSSSNQCTLDPSAGKPRMIYAEDELPKYYFPNTCNGVSGTAGDVRKVCEYFTPGSARWVMLESKDFLSTTASATAMWFLGPTEVNHIQRPVALTHDYNWWSTAYGKTAWTSGTSDNSDDALVYLYPGSGIAGTCGFNPTGNPYWRFSTDRNWTWEDQFSIDIKMTNPENIDKMQIKLGRDPYCYWLFTVTGTLSTTWQTHVFHYKEAERIIAKDTGLSEPVYTTADAEFYEVDDAPYSPMPYLNHGYIEMTVSGSDGTDVYIRGLKNVRTRFKDGWMFLGVDESLYIPDIDLVNTGTISFNYKPSEAAVKLVEADHREFMFDILNISNSEASISLVLNPQYGWEVFCWGIQEQQILDYIPTVKESESILPSSSNPGPFEIVLSWAPDHIPGLTDSIVLWVNGIKVCAGDFASLGSSFKTDDIKITLGRGASIIHDEDKTLHAAYAWFSDLKIFKYAVNKPTTNVEDASLIPENMLELSEDGIAWKSFANGELPIRVSGVENREGVTFYMRNKRPKKDVKLLQKRGQASLIVMWEVSQSW